MRVSVHSGDLGTRCARLHMDGKPDSAGDRRHNSDVTTFCRMPSRNHATIGVMSIEPMSGMMRRNGASIHSVVGNDQRTQGEYWSFGNQDEITRTMIASFSSENAHDTSSIGIPRGS